jgi:hypothetical protein
MVAYPEHVVVAKAELICVSRTLERNIVLLVKPSQQNRAADYLPIGQLLAQRGDILDADPVRVLSVTIDRQGTIISIDELPHVTFFIDTKMR